MSITYSERVFVALGIQHGMRMRRIILLSVPPYNIFPHYLINGTIFAGKKVIEHKMCFNVSPCIFQFNN